jgi:hypothetical protein
MLISLGVTVTAIVFTLIAFVKLFHQRYISLHNSNSPKSFSEKIVFFFQGRNREISKKKWKP